MADIASVRASAAPLAFRCPASARAASVPINETHQASDVGNAAHEALRPLAETGTVDWDAISAIAEKHQAPEDEVRMLCALGAKLWPSVSQS
ncbi:MAG TPA: hypothetical protein VGJ84_23570, partial [Polyangiaceae bacterium]